jgi:hypothetical protein
MRLVMLKSRQTVYGKKVNAGEEFEVPDAEGKTWCLLGLARVADNKTSFAEEPAAEPRARRGRYSRSDMRAGNESRADLRSEDDE